MKSLTPSTVESPLAWFEAFIINDGFDLLHEEFKAHAKKNGGYFMPAHPYTGLDDESVYYIDMEANDEMNTIRYTFEKYFENRFSNEYGLAILHLDKKLIEIEDERACQKYITLALTLIKSFLEIAHKKDGFTDKIYLHKVLNDLKEYIDFKLKSPQSSDNRKQKIIYNKNQFGYFGNVNMIDYLFNTLAEIGLFEDDENQRKLFYDALTKSEEPTDSKLKIVCKNGEAAYIFQELKILFYELTPSIIEKSRLFTNKKGTIITANDLSKALTIYNKKFPNPSKERIDKMITGLKGYKR